MAVHRFGVFELATDSGELRRGGVRLRATPQAVRLLTLLVERRGDVVTREEIRDAIWPREHFIEHEQAINSLVRQIRTLLVDTAVAPRYIETIPKRGYRFIGVMEAAAPPPVIAAAPVSPKRNGLVVLLLLLVFRSSWVPLPSPADEYRISVTPFVVDGDPSSAAIAQRITERLLHELTVLRPVGVSVDYGGSDSPRPNLRVTGRITTAAGESSAVIRVVDESMREVWSEQYTDPRQWPDEAARATAGAAARSLIPLFTGDTPVQQDWGPETMRLYREARARSRNATWRDLEEAERLYAEVLRRAPRFAEAHSGLACVLTMFAVRGMVSPETGERAREALRQAIALRPTLAEAHMAAGVFALVEEHRPADAAESLRRAIELERTYADAYAWRAQAFSALGEHEAAIAHMRIAQHLHAQYDTSTVRGLLYFNARRFEEAAAEYHRVLEREPSLLMALWGMAAAQTKMGHENEAREYLRRALLADPQASEADRRDTDVRGRVILVMERRVAQRAMSPYRLAAFSCMQGDAERCLSAVDRAVETRADGSVFAHVDPAFDLVRNQPRFQTALARPAKW